MSNETLKDNNSAVKRLLHLEKKLSPQIESIDQSAIDLETNMGIFRSNLDALQRFPKETTQKILEEIGASQTNFQTKMMKTLEEITRQSIFNSSDKLAQAAKAYKKGLESSLDETKAVLKKTANLRLKLRVIVIPKRLRTL